MDTLPIFKTIQRIKNTVRENTAQGHIPYQIDTIRDAIIQHTQIDRVEYVEIDEPDNPIRGRYLPYLVQSKGVYDHDPDIMVEVHYLKELNTCWSRYVACKEMCHGFTANKVAENNMAQVASNERLIRLVEMLISQSQDTMGPFPPMMDEEFASMAALQILCPVEDRLKLNEYKENMGVELGNLEIAKLFRIPRQFVPSLMDPLMIGLAQEVLLGQDLA